MPNRTAMPPTFTLRPDVLCSGGARNPASASECATRFERTALAFARGANSNSAGNDTNFVPACLQGSAQGLPTWARYLPVVNDRSDEHARLVRVKEQGWHDRRPARDRHVTC